MARVVYRRLTQPVFGPAGEVVHEPGEILAVDAPLDTAARFDLVEVDEPDPAPAPEPPKTPRHATVKPGTAAGAGGAYP